MPNWKIQTYITGGREVPMKAWGRGGDQEQKVFWWVKNSAFVVNVSLMPTLGICSARPACTHVRFRGNPGTRPSA